MFVTCAVYLTTNFFPLRSFCCDLDTLVFTFVIWCVDLFTIGRCRSLLGPFVVSEGRTGKAGLLCLLSDFHIYLASDVMFYGVQLLVLYK